ncbi:hypothetical protein [Variovorax sp. M-6]|uniref:hypothetical protein n=1 Tax=Variovorax sp. M-6 TaxID=3233041 RepID=UPI003F9BD57F
MRIAWSAIFAFAVVTLAGCQGAGYGVGYSGSDATAPLPDDIRILEPRKDMDPRKTAFLGRWEGVWVGGHDRVQHILIVETLSEDTFSAVYALGDSMSPYGRIARSWKRVYGVPQPGKLVITTYANIRPVVTTYEMQADGTISATYSPGIGPASNAKMVRVATK